MSPEIVGILGIAIMLILFGIGMPVAFAMCLVGLMGFTYLCGPEAALTLLANDIFELFSSYSLSVIPMFILMGCFAYATGIGKRLYDVAYTWMGRLRGGLAIATIFACAGFGAICGSATATSATMSKIALPEMKRHRYADSIATGCVAASGTLGILIPPSTVFIIYGLLVEESIGKLFISGILPGLLLCMSFIGVVFFLCMRNPSLAPTGSSVSWKSKMKASWGIVDAAILFIFAIGGLFMGWFSPTQSGAIGAGGTLIIGLFRRQLTWEKFLEAGTDGLRMSCMILFIIMGATVFGHFLVVTNIPSYLVELVETLPVSRILIMWVIIFIFFIAGLFMDAMAVIVVAVPIFFPLVSKLGFDPIWFGVITVLVSGIGIITPPVGVNVFIVKGISQNVPLSVVFRGTLPFIVAMFFVIILVMIFPQIATFLPSLIS